ncbi:MAG: PAS domain-containing protein [Burkholderiales bacterium]|nr:PAS domain-containing protein [Burkholderiales bacterium]
MEEQVAAQLHFTQELIESLPTALYLKDEAGRYQEFNKAFESLFGIVRKDWIGKTVFDLVPGDMATMMDAKDKELFRDGVRRPTRATLPTAPPARPAMGCIGRPA